MKTGARVSVEGKGLRQHRDAAPIPFSWAMAAKIVSRDGFNADLDEPRDGIFVQVRMDANHQPRNSGFHACPAPVKDIETCLRVGGRGRNLGDRQQCPLRVAKGHQVSSGRSGLPRQPRGCRCKYVAIYSCWPSSHEFLGANTGSD
jgi:hypothetical protein